MKSSRALTLVEVVIAMCLMTVLAGLTLSLLTSANSFLRSGTQRSDRARLYAVLYETLGDEFFHMGARYRSISEDGTSCVHRSAWTEDQEFITDTQGYPVWQSWIAFSIVDSQLVRRRKAIEVPGTPLDEVTQEWEKTDVLVPSVEMGRWESAGPESIVLTLQVPMERERQTLEFLLTAGQGEAL